MNPNLFRRNELLAQKVIRGLESRNMSGYYAASREEALRLALSLIPEGSTVTMGGGMSVHEIGLPQALREGNRNFLDRDKTEDKRAAMLAAYDADVFLSSVNAMTEDGVLINIDGNANRVSAIAQGPKKVLFIVGMNKVCPDVDSAMKRARGVAAPANAQRFGLFFGSVDPDNFVGFDKVQLVFQPRKDGRILGRCVVEHDDLSFHRCILIE